MSRQDLEGSCTPDVRSETEGYLSASASPMPPSLNDHDAFVRAPASTPVDSSDEDVASSNVSSYLASPMRFTPNHVANPAPVDSSDEDVESSIMLMAASALPAAPASSASSVILKKMLCGTVDFLRIAAVTQTLLSRWLHQLFLQLERRDAAPSQTVQETWLGYPIMGCSALLAILVKTLNAAAKGGEYLAAEDYLFAVFCSSLFYFFMDLIVGAQSMPLGAFIVTSAIAIPLAGAFFLKIISPDSDDRFYLSAADLNYIQQLQYASGQPGERFFNAVTGVKHGGESLTVLCWMINREVHGKTVALPAWQMSLVGVALLVAAKMGYDLTDNPIRFQKFVMLAKFFQDAALSYAAFSGIFYMLFSENPLFDHAAFRGMLIMVGALFALGIGFFSAATTRFRFEENVEGIESIVGGMRAAGTLLGDCAAFTKKSVSGMFSCCSKKEQDTGCVQYSEEGVAAQL